MDTLNKILLIIITGLLTFSVFMVPNLQDIQMVEASNDDFNEDQQKFLEYLNEFRKDAGLNEITLNPILNKAAENHAYYFINNWDLSNLYGEIEGNEGFTGKDVYDRIIAAGGDVDLASRSFDKMIANFS
ncbi:CAP domain-containing protein, partial [Actinocorallia longicatena]|uniref:CAP domain-containing protein n=1 Tax=Actinocorallia longicatena TaxID=111803 RepID=UPI0031D5C5DC